LTHVSIDRAPLQRLERRELRAKTMVAIGALHALAADRDRARA
jgi:hypothetical protein